MRLSSEMFPFASHIDYGYNLSFASEVLEEAGKVIAELGHRVSTHPGQFTQLGSPRKEVVDNAIRDLDYHNDLLTRLKLPEQEDRDAVMILHMGGTFGSKEETLDRFRTNYARLSEGVKRRLVLENDDVSWHVHDLLPICEELNIPMVLDFHHHNILFDESQVREGTKDVVALYPRIKATWTRKGITQKMHYSEQTPAAITPMKRRKHSPRVATLPPCADDMDLMIEAKDKEQAVFELMRTFKLPGYQLFNDIIPHTRTDENAKTNTRKKKTDEEVVVDQIADEFVGMGGPDRRVYWPPGMEDWLRPKKRETKPKVEENSAKRRKALGKKDRPEIPGPKPLDVKAEDDETDELSSTVAKPKVKTLQNMKQLEVTDVKPHEVARPKTKTKVAPPADGGDVPSRPVKTIKHKVKAKVATLPDLPAESTGRRSKRVSRVSYAE